jgi:hypothetical protein
VDRGWGMSCHYSARLGENHTFDLLSKREFFSLLCPNPKNPRLIGGSEQEIQISKHSCDCKEYKTDRQDHQQPYPSVYHMFSYYKDAEEKSRVNESIQDESEYPRPRTTSTWVERAK